MDRGLRAGLSARRPAREVARRGQVLYLSITSSPMGRLSADDLLMLGRLIQQRRQAAEQKAA